MSFAATFRRRPQRAGRRRLVGALLIGLLALAAGGVLFAALDETPAGVADSSDPMPRAVQDREPPRAEGDLAAGTWAFDGSLFESLDDDVFSEREQTPRDLALALVSEDESSARLGTRAFGQSGRSASSNPPARSSLSSGERLVSDEQFAALTQPATAELIAFIGPESVTAPRSAANTSGGGTDPNDDPNNPDPPTVIPTPAAAAAGLALLAAFSLPRRRG